jgi:hypothetical protein
MTASNLEFSTGEDVIPGFWDSSVELRFTIGDHIDRLLQIFGPVAAETSSVQFFEVPEPELIPSECCRLSGILNFWNDPSEDIYTSEDGEPR